MPDAPDTNSRRRLIMVVAVGVLLIAAVVGGTLLKQSGEPVRSVAALCAQLDQAKNLDNALTSLDPTTLAPQVRALKAAAPVAPKEIETQVSTLSEFVGSLLQEVDAAAPADRRKVLADSLARREAEIDGITAAGQAVQDWAAQNCNLDLGDSSSSVTP
ncbi:MAG: hypothetical protein F2837_08525 [Actinobacteria bacterium]|nr:hypothetical protein [Actinomycetota bacterium]